MVFCGSKTSVNSRLIKEEIQECRFGYCLRRLIHTIVDLRRRHPHLRIYISKIDFKSAYRRLHFAWRLAIQATTAHKDLAFIALRLTFGGAACPSEWSNMSEVVTDLAAVILNSEEWNPNNLSSPVTNKIPTCKNLPDNTPFEPGLPIIVDPKTPKRGTCDVYIDDIATVTVDEPGNALRAKEVVPLAVHALGRPQSEVEHLPRDNLVSISKLAAEGSPTEEIVMLGFLLNTRRLTISLPNHKFTAWSTSVKNIKARGVTTHDELDTMVGRLTHLSAIVPPILHFMSRLRQLRDRAQNRREILVP